MNVQAPLRALQQGSALTLVDCDIHPRPRSLEDLRPYMAQRWWDYTQTYGLRRRHGYAKGHPYPKSSPGDGMRLDAWPENGLSPGADLDFMRAQHLDAYGVTYGIMNPLGPSGQGDQNRELSIALATATNHWQLADWADPEPRLRPSIVVPYEDGEASAAEIHRCAADGRFAQVLLLSRTAEALGRRRYWPIYEAAMRHGLPIALHIGGTNGMPCTASGWASYYFEEHHSNVQSIEAMVTSMTVEGVFETFPKLRILLIESGFAWVPALCWRLDKHWRRLKSEVPHLRRAPSEYIRANISYTTQPIDEPERRGDLARLIEWVGIDRILFATDYPHWDFDDPHFVFRGELSAAQKAQIFRGNARAYYRLD